MEKPFNPQEDIAWADLAASREWAQITAFVIDAIDRIRMKIENPEITETMDDLRYQQGKLTAFRELLQAPEYYQRMAELLKENQRGAGKMK